MAVWFEKVYWQALINLETFAQTSLEELPDEKWVKTLEGARVEAFRLQSLGRILQKASKKKLEWTELGTDLRTYSKKIEDWIGVYLYAFEMHEGLLRESPSLELLNRSTQSLEAARTLFLEQWSALPESLGVIEAALLEMKGFDLQKRYLKGFRRRLKKAESLSSEIDPLLLEDGTHELRRKLRWLVMGFVYPQGLFGYQDIEAGTQIDQYTELSPIGGAKSVFIPAVPLVALSQMVGRLGGLKDEGLLDHYKKTLTTSGDSFNENQSRPEIVEATSEMLNQLTDSRVVRLLRKEL